MGKEQTGASEVTDRGLPVLVNSDKPKFFGLWNETVNLVNEFMNSVGSAEEVQKKIEQLESNITDVVQNASEQQVELDTLGKRVDDLPRRGCFAVTHALSAEQTSVLYHLSEANAKLVFSLKLTESDNTLVKEYVAIRKKNEAMSLNVLLGGVRVKMTVSGDNFSVNTSPADPSYSNQKITITASNIYE